MLATWHQWHVEYAEIVSVCEGLVCLCENQSVFMKVMSWLLRVCLAIAAGLYSIPSILRLA